MKKLILIFFTFHFSLFTLKAQGLWIQRSSMSIERAYNVSFSIGGVGYIGLGTNGGISFHDLWQFNPSTNTWLQKAKFPGLIRACPAVFVIGHKAYLVTGTDSNFTSLTECWVYDAISDTWTQKSNFSGPARGYDIGFAIGDKGFIGTGYDIATTTTYGDIWEYDTASDTWTKKTNFPGPARFGASGFAVGNNGYICFGGQAYGCCLLKDIWKYDTTNDTWTQKTSYPPAIDIFSLNGFVIGTNIYTGTGQDSSRKCYQWFWKYNTVNDSWTQEANFIGAARGDCSAFSIADTGYFGLGIDSTPVYYSDFYKFYPDTLTGIKNITSSQSDISIYPNPFTTVCCVSLPTDVMNQSPLITLYTMEGSKIKADITRSDGGIIIKRGNLQNGIYILSIQNGNISIYKKLVLIN